MRIEHLHRSVVRIATVGGTTTTLLKPALSALQENLPGVSADVLTMRPEEVQRCLLEGSIDLGLVNLLEDDDQPPTLAGIDLMRGAPVAVLPASHPLCQRREISPAELAAETFVMMHTGHLMRRFAEGLLAESRPRTCHLTDGAELGKLLVAGGVGVTILPSYCVFGDPLERSGLIAARPITDVRTSVRLVLQYRRRQPPAAVQVLRSALAEFSRAA